MKTTYTNHKGICSALKTIRTLDKKQAEVKDTTTTGLYLRIYQSGSAQFIHRYKIDKKRRVFTFTAKLDITSTEKEIASTLSKVRGEHAKQQELIKLNGIDPALERDLHIAEIATTPTFSAFITTYIKHMQQQGKQSWKESQRALIVDIATFIGDMKITDIERKHLVSLLDKKQEQGKLSTRNHLISYLSAYFNYAIERDLIQQNPVTGIKKIKLASRQRVLSQEEISYLWQQTSEESNLSLSTRHIIRLALLTGQRIGEICKAKTSDIKDRVWVITDTKNGLTHHLPITPMMQIIFDAAQPHARNHLLFPSSTDSVTRSQVISKIFSRLDWRGTESKPTPHDLRRTLATGISELGFNRLIQDKVTNHIDNSVSGIYDRHDYMKEKQQALEAWQAHLKNIITSEEIAL